MNVIETIRSLLASFPRIAELTGVIHVDFTDGTVGSCSLSPTGDTLVYEDIIGNQRRAHTFLFSQEYSAINDYERVSSSGLLLELAVWLSKQNNIPVQTVVDEIPHDGEITKISAANGMLIVVPQENTADAYLYQLTITAEYTIEFS